MCPLCLSFVINVTCFDINALCIYNAYELISVYVYFQMFLGFIAYRHVHAYLLSHNVC